MAKPSTREELKQYCLRTLGQPVIEINVEDDQLEDRPVSYTHLTLPTKA